MLNKIIRYSIFMLFIFLIPLNAKTYSLQLATFTSKENAIDGYKRLKFKEKDSVFLYKTDRGYWTLRYYLSESYSHLKKYKNRSKEKIIKNSLVAVTTESKIIFMKNGVSNIINPFGEIEEKTKTEKKISSKPKPKQEDKTKEIVKTFQKKKTENLEVTFEEFVDSKEETAIEENIILERIKKLNKDSYKISHFTFQIAVKNYMFLIQFGKPPYDFNANSVFQLNSRLGDQSALTISNENGHLVFVFEKSVKSEDERELKIRKLLRKIRKNPNVRVKVFRRN